MASPILNIADVETIDLAERGQVRRATVSGVGGWQQRLRDLNV